MQKEFIPYEQALELKELGFDEYCFTTAFGIDITLESDIKMPLYQQAFRWFREKYQLCIVIKPIDDKKLDLGYNLTKNCLIISAHLTYESAELACLKKLIEIVKSKKD
jgi:hypothetical protein